MHKTVLGQQPRVTCRNQCVAVVYLVLSQGMDGWKAMQSEEQLPQSWPPPAPTPLLLSYYESRSLTNFNGTRDLHGSVDPSTEVECQAVCFENAT